MLVFINKIIQILVKMVDLAWWLTYLRINCCRRSKFTPAASWVWWICFLYQLNKQFAHLQIFKNLIRFHQSYKTLFFLQVLLAQRHSLIFAEHGIWSGFPFLVYYIMVYLSFYTIWVYVGLQPAIWFLIFWYLFDIFMSSVKIIKLYFEISLTSSVN